LARRRRPTANASAVMFVNIKFGSIGQQRPSKSAAWSGESANQEFYLFGIKPEAIESPVYGAKFSALLGAV
jgi:hypothetical protein